MSLRGYVTVLENENKMLRELWTTLGMPEPEYDCLGTEFTHSRKRREDFLRNVLCQTQRKHVSDVQLPLRVDSVARTGPAEASSAGST